MHDPTKYMMSIALLSSAILGRCASRSPLLSSVSGALIGWNCHFQSSQLCIVKHEDLRHCMSVHGSSLLFSLNTRLSSLDGVG